jgi:ribonuclease HI
VLKFSSGAIHQKSGGAATAAKQELVLPCQTKHVYTDASPSGYGAYYVLASNPQRPAGVLRESWTNRQLEKREVKDQSYRELFGILRAIKAFGTPLSGNTVVLYCDNQNVVSGIKKGKMRGTCGELLPTLLKTVESKAIKLEVRWISKRMNKKADALSRGKIEKFKEL